MPTDLEIEDYKQYCARRVVITDEATRRKRIRILPPPVTGQSVWHGAANDHRQRVGR